MSIIGQDSVFDQHHAAAPGPDAAATVLLDGLKFANQITNLEHRINQITRIICNRAPVHDLVLKFGIDCIEASAAPFYMKRDAVSRIYRAHGIGTPEAIGQGEPAVDRGQIAGEKTPHAIQDTPCMDSEPNDTKSTPVDERPTDTPQADHGLMLVDVEAYRWSYAAGQGPHFMLYSLAAHLAENNRVSIDALAAAAGHSQSYFYELLALSAIEAGKSLFYGGRDGQWLYLRSQKKIGARLALLLLENDLHKVLDGRRPGIRRRYVSIHAEHAEMWAAWLDSKRNRRLSRQVEIQLWNVTDTTVRRWDKEAGIEAQRNYAQTADLRDERVPADREDYMVAQQDGQLVAMWQQANTYHVKQTFREHPHRGQSRKVRKAISAVLSTEQPANNLVAAHPFRTQHFAGGSDPLQAWKDYQRALKNAPFAQVHDLIYRGERQRVRALHRPAIWEQMTPRPGQDAPRTTANQYTRVN